MTRLSEPSMDERRAKILRDMKSPASMTLLGVSLSLLLLSFVFHDRPLTNDNQIISYFRGEHVVSTP